MNGWRESVERYNWEQGSEEEVGKGWRWVKLQE